MSLSAIGWIFTLGVLAHNVEEALLLPSWSTRAGRFYKPVAAPTFRIAVIILSVLFIGVTTAATFAHSASAVAYLMAGYVLAMVLNVFAPHVIATIAMHRYMPGTLTGLLFNLPLGIWYLVRALAEGHITLPTFYWAGPVVVLGTVLLLPGLFAAGRALHTAAG